ncbi:hypothetical protein BKA67DRAFT_119187 [Truncatella angustata]|uniref:Uncharacterized protein n=1 Tax=Truncatella angustata TaxID=152316 RepID=A0A9P8RK99_9PEZI|nr:uncharacterized protein BKA67DRAFT_119187 [Truncatella angustata]KAH6645601.1 hypothetical protein BKA67DRAFT_119187 [Truncatella angustata]
MSMVYEHVPSLIATYLVSHKHTSYVLYHAAKRFRKPSSAILFLHILIPNLEILRYWAHYVQYGYHVSPAYLDFIVMIFHSCTSHYLVQKGHYAGHKKIVQPVFHAQMLLRLAISFCSVFLGFPSLHSATIKINAAASYPRILIWAMKRLKVLSDYKAVYTAAMFVGGLLAGHDSGIWYGPQVFIGCWAGLYVLETWAAQKVPHTRRYNETDTSEETLPTSNCGSDTSTIAVSHLRRIAESYLRTFVPSRTFALS